MFEQHCSTVNPFTFDVNTFTTVCGNVPYMTPGQRIKAERLARDWTQLELSKKVGCTRELISTWESDGVGDRSGKFLTALLQAFGKTSDWLENGKESRVARPGKSSQDDADSVSEATEVDPARHAELRAVAIDMTFSSLLKALFVNTPAAAVTFRDHLEALAGELKPKRMASNKGLIGTALGIARPTAAAWEENAQREQQRASAVSKKR